MRVPRRFSLLAGSAVAVAGLLVAACGTSLPTSSDGSAVLLNHAAANLTAADVILAGADAGYFSAIAPFGNLGRATSKFWDNHSADEGSGADCNAGFYASGTLVPGSCNQQSPGSDANQGGYDRFWGDNGPGGTSAGRDASSFMFKGANNYTVTLVGAYSGGTSHVGWYTKSNGTYTFHEIPEWTSKQINFVVVIPNNGADWGFYIQNTFNPQTGGCGNDVNGQISCSDATGSYQGAPFQQFALFGSSTDGSKYLVASEDNTLETLPNGNQLDSDYNDYIFSVVATPNGGTEETPTATFVIGDDAKHSIGDIVNFWGAQWWKNNPTSGQDDSGWESFKGFADIVNGGCGSTWSTLPGNSSNPPKTIPKTIQIIVTDVVHKNGNVLSGNIRQIITVNQDGKYKDDPGHAGGGPVTGIVCTAQ